MIASSNSSIISAVVSVVKRGSCQRMIKEPWHCPIPLDWAHCTWGPGRSRKRKKQVTSSRIVTQTKIIKIAIIQLAEIIEIAIIQVLCQDSLDFDHIVIQTGCQNLESLEARLARTPFSPFKSHDSHDEIVQSELCDDSTTHGGGSSRSQ